jgi:hypothetical protein
MERLHPWAMPSLDRIMMGGGVTRPVADKNYVLVAVAVEGKPTCLCPAVGYRPQHQVPVDFIEAIPGIKVCGPEAAVWHVA